jgi:hypothetical protein
MRRKTTCINTTNTSCPKYGRKTARNKREPSYNIRGLVMAFMGMLLVCGKARGGELMICAEWPLETTLVIFCQERRSSV